MRCFPFLAFWTLILLGVASACKDDRIRDFPQVGFEEYIYLNNPSSAELRSPGGAIFHTGGFRGLIIVRRFMNGNQRDFAAYDRACPQHFREDCSRLEFDEDNLFVKCPCHGEKYLLFDGSPSDDANISLFEYSATFNSSVVVVRN